MDRALVAADCGEPAPCRFTETLDAHPPRLPSLIVVAGWSAPSPVACASSAHGAAGSLTKKWKASSGTDWTGSTFRRRWIVAAEAEMDEERITRIARAMCRAARLDPDKPAGNAGPYTMSMREPGHETLQPAWMLFRREAVLFASRHREVAVRP